MGGKCHLGLRVVKKGVIESVQGQCLGVTKNYVSLV